MDNLVVPGDYIKFRIGTTRNNIVEYNTTVDSFIIIAKVIATQHGQQYALIEDNVTDNRSSFNLIKDYIERWKNESFNSLISKDISLYIGKRVTWLATHQFRKTEDPEIVRKATTKICLSCSKSNIIGKFCWWCGDEL